MKKISLDSIYKPKDETVIQQELTAREVRSSAIRHIGISNKSSGQLRTFLNKQALDPEVVEATIADLIDEGYIDDWKIARRILRERTAGKTESQAAIRMRLARQGIPDLVIDELAVEMTGDDESAALLVKARLSRELQAFVRADREEKRRLLGKMNRFLQSHGYSMECTRKVIIALLADVEQVDDQTID